MKNKRIDHISKIMSKRHGIFTENFTIFFSNAEKKEECRNLNWINSRRPSFGDHVSVTSISSKPVSWILSNFIYFKYFIQ